MHIWGTGQCPPSELPLATRTRQQVLLYALKHLIQLNHKGPLGLDLLPFLNTEMLDSSFTRWEGGASLLTQ